MAKIKLTKGELKRQRDALRQFERYLPTLQLKKQQLQMEILHLSALLEEKKRQSQAKESGARVWSGLIVEFRELHKEACIPARVATSIKNIAGVDVPVFMLVEWAVFEYDLFTTAPWLDAAIDSLREIVSLKQEIRVIEESAAVLRHELRITTQRVNLFEKVKIPEAQDSIRKIKISIGDQMANAVGRCKIAKRKIEELYATAGAA
jgi:V/A-type H+-transporting ATPase subunit D